VADEKVVGNSPSLYSEGKIIEKAERLQIVRWLFGGVASRAFCGFMHRHEKPLEALGDCVRRYINHPKKNIVERPAYLRKMQSFWRDLNSD
jgi:hypothetical protein